jgi:proteasome lid subunit RPN8/RPN11
MTIWARRGPNALLRIRRRPWRAMLTELKKRGRGHRESGAFLLGDRGGDGRTVTRVVFLDDLDPNCLTGGISLEGFAYSKLWDICDAEEKVVIGDVHTHPGGEVRQSSIDAANPMLAMEGHIALIVPNFASDLVDAAEVGVHRYDGVGWRTWRGVDAAQRLFIRRLL